MACDHPLEIVVEERKDVRIVSLVGDWTRDNPSLTGGVLMDRRFFRLDTSKRVVLDLTDVFIMDSWGESKLINAFEDYREAGGQLALVAEPNRAHPVEVQRHLRDAGVPSFPSVETALVSLGLVRDVDENDLRRAFAALFDLVETQVLLRSGREGEEYTAVLCSRDATHNVSASSPISRSEALRALKSILLDRAKRAIEALITVPGSV